MESLIDEFDLSADISKTNYQLAFYCGVVESSRCSNPEETADCMMTHVQFALDRAKGAHSSTIWFFDSELHKRRIRELYRKSYASGAERRGVQAVFTA